MKPCCVELSCVGLEVRSNQHWLERGASDPNCFSSACVLVDHPEMGPLVANAHKKVVVQQLDMASVARRPSSMAHRAIITHAPTGCGVPLWPN